MNYVIINSVENDYRIATYQFLDFIINDIKTRFPGETFCLFSLGILYFTP